MRHRLYFFIPFSVLAAAAVDAIFPRRFSKQSAYLFSIFLAGWYLPMNLRISKDFRHELRTNDLEWQFLYSAAKSWPPGCRAVYPYGDAKKVILKIFFALRKRRAGSGLRAFLQNSALRAYRPVNRNRRKAQGRTAEIFRKLEANRVSLDGNGFPPQVFYGLARPLSQH